MVETFIEKLEQMLESLQKQFGPISLFAVLKMDDITDKWSMIVGAEWVQEENRSKAFAASIQFLKEHFDKEERSSIARIGVFPLSNHLVEIMLNEFKSKEVINDDKKINGNVIHEGMIIKSEK